MNDTPAFMNDIPAFMNDTPAIQKLFSCIHE